MLNTKLFEGESVRLATPEPGEFARLLKRWNKNTEYYRLLDSCPVRLWSEGKIQGWIEEEYNKEHRDELMFVAYTLADGCPIGFIELAEINWAMGDAWVALGIGEREYWGKGYGTDMMKVILRYAFHELNLHRVSLDVFEYNPRAVRSYEKSGFMVEGRERKALQRDGKFWDMIYMGVLREEWEKTSRV